MKQNYRFILFISLSAILLLLHISRNWTITSTSKEAIFTIQQELKTARHILELQKPQSPVGQYLFRYSRKALIEWSDNKTPTPVNPDSLKPGLVTLTNGIYLFDCKKEKKTTLVYLKPIQLLIPVRNKYLNTSNSFPGEISLNPKAGLEQLDYLPQSVYFRPKQVSLSSFKLFSPEYYASSQLNTSFGLVIVHLLWLTSLFLLLSRLSWQKNIAPMVALCCLLTSVISTNYFLQSLVFDSTLSLNPFNIINLDSIDFALPLLILLLAALFIISFRFTIHTWISDKKWILTASLIVLVYSILSIYWLGFPILVSYWFLAALLPIVLFPSKWSTVTNRLLPVLIFSMSVSMILTHYESERINTEQGLICEKLVNHDDPIVEYLIEERLPALEKMAADNPVLVTNPTSFLNQYLFTGYLSGYKLIIPDSLVPIRQLGFSFMFQQRHYAFTSTYTKAGFGFPQLFANREFSDFEGKGFSTARFIYGQLIQSTGTFAYPRRETFRKEEYTTLSHYRHLVRRVGPETFVVSYPIKTWTHYFSITALVLLISWVISGLSFVSNPFKIQTLQQRTRLTFLSLLALSGVAFGTFACYYLFDQFNQKNRQILSEKMKSVKALLMTENSFPQHPDDLDLNIKLARLSELLFTDISVYRPSGQLIATSQPDIFNKGLLSRNILPGAYHTLQKEHADLIILNEHIGNLNYLSAYSPLTNEHNQVVAYVNLPYFAKQIELNNQLSSFVASVIAVWVVLTFVGFLLAIFLANRITYPLKLIREKLQQLDLKKENQPISYSTNDEIGALVSAYNTKVEELLNKAEALARSERESAWREMAKQVAHEIKNPLTPIKLNAQLLQRNLENNDPDLPIKVNRFVNGLIDQINTLTKIANEFSNYAALPKAIEEEVDLATVLQNAISIMAQEQVMLTPSIHANPIVLADRNLITRVINNLLKNAIQATEEKEYAPGEQAKITLELSSAGKTATLKIIDNGVGIPPELADKIFSPSFTTKTTGMGLGLAMVKQIIEQAGGEISFSSEPGKGTTFTVQLPLKEE